METELYDRQLRLDLHIPVSAIVVGIGGTGFFVAQQLAMSGVETLHLLDGDRLEHSNFNRIPLPPEANFGKLKTEAAKEHIESLRPDCTIYTYGKATSFSLELTEGEILFDCTDNQDTQLMLSKWAKTKGIRYIRCGYNGTHLTITGRVPAWRTTETARTGYEIFPSWVVPASIAAGFAVSKAMYAPETEVGADLRELGGRPDQGEARGTALARGDVFVTEDRGGWDLTQLAEAQAFLDKIKPNPEEER